MLIEGENPAMRTLTSERSRAFDRLDNLVLQDLS